MSSPEPIRIDQNGVEAFAPPPMPDGEMAPPWMVDVAVGSVGPDAAGRVYVIWRVGDGSVGTELRLPWRAAMGVAMKLAQETETAVARIAAAQGPQLIRPGHPLFEQTIQRNGDDRG